MAGLVLVEFYVLFEFYRGLEYCAFCSPRYLQMIQHVDWLLFGLYLGSPAGGVLFPIDLRRVEVPVLLSLRVRLALGLLPGVLADFSWLW